MNYRLKNLQEALAEVQKLGARIVGDMEASDAALPECGPHTKALLADLKDELDRTTTRALHCQSTIERLGQLCDVLNPLMPEHIAALRVQLVTDALVYCTDSPEQGVAALQAADMAGIPWKDAGPGYSDATRYIEFTGYEGDFAILAAALDALPCAPQEAQ